MPLGPQSKGMRYFPNMTIEWTQCYTRKNVRRGGTSLIREYFGNKSFEFTIADALKQSILLLESHS